MKWDKYFFFFLSVNFEIPVNNNLVDQLDICGVFQFSSMVSGLLMNPFVPNAPFLYPLKTSENDKAF